MWGVSDEVKPMPCGVCEEVPETPWHLISIHFADNGELVEKQCGYIYVEPTMWVCSLPCFFDLASEMYLDYIKEQSS